MIKRNYFPSINYIVTLFILFFWLTSSQKVSASSVTTDSESTADTSCTVSFKANGGEGDAASITATYGDTYGDLPEVTRANYDFIGWYTFKSGGFLITADSKVIKPTDHTLYAHWRGVQKEITLDPNGGTLDNTTVKVYYGSKFRNQLPTLSRSDYTFDGWYTSADGGDKITSKSIYGEDTATTLYAHWTQKTIKVNLIAFNGEFYEMEVTNGSPYGELPVPEKEGFTFLGWYKWRDYANYKAKEITADTVVDEVGQITLLARWYVNSSNTTN